MLASVAPAAAGSGELRIVDVVRVGTATWRVTGETAVCVGPSTILFDVGDSLVDPVTVGRVKKPTHEFSAVVTWAPPPDATSAVVGLRCDQAMPAGPPFELTATWSFVIGPPPPNQAPIAKDDVFKIPAGGTLTVKAPGILRNDADPDGDALTVIPGQHTTLAASTKMGVDGSLRITFPAGWNGGACLAYTVSDGRGGDSAPAYVRVKVGKPTGTWALDQCERLQAVPLEPPMGALKAKAGYHWEFLWSIGAPFGSFIQERYRAYCKQSQGVLVVRYGRWWAHYNCWRWGPYRSYTY